MGIVRTEESKRAELEELRRMLVACAGLHRRKDGEDFRAPRVSSGELAAAGDRLVCVTSGVSYLGLAIVNRLLVRGYSVRIIVHNQEEIEKLREMENSGEMSTPNNNFTAVMANLVDPESLSVAFEGCRGVFHTSAFTDPAGLSGYTKSMAEIEVRATENVIEACARTPSVRNCLLTSSLLACIWQDSNEESIATVVNDDCWSDESLCIGKKLWYALGKLKAEKAAWRTAKETGLKLATICPGLITGPEFCRRNPTATIAYLKGAQEVYTTGLLATVDVIRLAEAHISVYREMNKTASGRYICFDQVITSDDEAEKLAMQVEMPANKICGNGSAESTEIPFQLSNKKLKNLMSQTHRCVNES